jgi:hypothetical protein
MGYHRDTVAMMARRVQSLVMATESADAEGTDIRQMLRNHRRTFKVFLVFFKWALFFIMDQKLRAKLDLRTWIARGLFSPGLKDWWSRVTPPTVNEFDSFLFGTKFYLNFAFKAQRKNYSTCIYPFGLSRRWGCLLSKQDWNDLLVINRELNDL